ncbi:unnamed protein product [Trichobilharzia regenti]|nr:unnamed protein product [Trichobilharzia regenti]
MIDYFTKWCETVPLQQHDANSVAYTFIGNCITRFSAPDSLHSDRGPAFEGQFVHHICSVFGIPKTRTTAYHSEGNSSAEHTNRKIGNILRAFINRLSIDVWDDTLPQCLLTHRSSVHFPTGFSPALLLYLLELRLPIEVQVPPFPLEQTDHVAYVRELRIRLAIAHDLARTPQKSSSYHQKNVYYRFIRGPKLLCWQSSLASPSPQV